MLGVLHRLIRDVRGVAAIEFALVLPLFITLFFGVVELCNYNLQSRRASMAVNFAAEFLSRDGNNELAVAERHVVEDIWMITNPTAYLATELRDGNWANGYARALASVRFDKTSGCKKDCAYEPETVWSFLYRDVVDQPVSVSCLLDVSQNSDELSGSAIRQGATGRTPVVIADFTYPYKPMLEGWLLPSAELHVRAIRRTRSGVLLEHAPDDFVTRCS